MSPEQFRALLRDPSTGPRLDRALAEDRVIDARERGPRACCADFGRVVACEDGIDVWVCPFGHTWKAACQ